MNKLRGYAAIIFGLAAVSNYPDGWIYTAIQLIALGGFLACLSEH